MGLWCHQQHELAKHFWACARTQLIAASSGEPRSFSTASRKPLLTIIPRVHQLRTAPRQRYMGRRASHTLSIRSHSQWSPSGQVFSPILHGRRIRMDLLHHCRHHLIRIPLGHRIQGTPRPLRMQRQVWNRHRPRRPHLRRHLRPRPAAVLRTMKSGGNSSSFSPRSISRRIGVTGAY